MPALAALKTHTLSLTKHVTEVSGFPLPLKCNRNAERRKSRRERHQSAALSDSFVERSSTNSRVTDNESNKHSSLDIERNSERDRPTACAHVLTHEVMSLPVSARPQALASQLIEQLQVLAGLNACACVFL